MEFPKELIDLRQWCGWKYYEGTKKMPIGRHGGVFRSNDKNTFEEFLICKARSDKIAFVIQADDPYVGVDLDDCIDDAGEIADWAWDI